MNSDPFPDPVSVTLDGRAFSVTCAGDPGAAPVLLLHGGGLDSARLSWRWLLPELAKTYHVIAPDWPGYGGSASLRAGHTISDLGAWVVRLLDMLGISRADTVGISMGAGVGFWLCLNSPDRIGRLVAAGPYGLQRRAPMHLVSWLLTRPPLTPLTFRVLRRYPGLLRRSLAAIFKHPERLTGSIVTEVAQSLVRDDVGHAFWRFQHEETGPRRLRSVFIDRLGEIQHPVLLIQGDGDRLVPVQAVSAAHALLPCARLEIVDAGHWPMREQPEIFNNLVTGFLDHTAITGTGPS